MEVTSKQANEMTKVSLDESDEAKSCMDALKTFLKEGLTYNIDANIRYISLIKKRQDNCLSLYLYL